MKRQLKDERGRLLFLINANVPDSKKQEDKIKAKTEEDENIAVPNFNVHSILQAGKSNRE